MRVEDVDKMVAWILKNNDGWDVEAVNAMFNSGERVDISVKSPPPILMTYITSWANNQGTISFRDDIYGFDKQGQIIFTDA